MAGEVEERLILSRDVGEVGGLRGFSLAELATARWGHVFTRLRPD